MLRGVIAGGGWGILIGVIAMALTSQLASWRDLSPALEGALVDAEEVIVADPEPGLGETPVVVAGSEQSIDAGDDRPEVPGGSTQPVADSLPDSTPPRMPGALRAPDAPVLTAEPGEAPVVALLTPEEPSRTGQVATVTAPDPGSAPALDNAPPVAPSPLAPGQDAAPAVPEAPAVNDDAAPSATTAEDAPVALAEAAPGGGVEQPRDMAPEAPTAPEPPAAPVAEADPAPPAPEVAEVTLPAVEPAEAPAAPAPQPEAPAAPAAPAPDSTASATPAPDPVPDPAPAAEPAAELAEAPAAPQPVDLPQIAAEPAPAPEPAPEPEGVAEASPPAPAPAPSVTRPAPGSALPGAPARRLPRIGDAVEEGTPAPAAPAAGDRPDVPALERYAVPFDRIDGAAPLSVILVLGPGATLTPQALQGADVPVTVAVPAGIAGAAGLIAEFRAAGAEVVLIPDLPPRPRAQDVEVSLSVALATLPGAVALMDLGRDGFQGSRQATAAVLAAAEGSGHGVITYAQGFNSAQRAADQAGIPAGLVERELDEGPGLARGLDQTAFKARQQGGAIAVATATPDVLRAVADWAAGADASGVALAPVSVVLGAE